MISTPSLTESKLLEISARCALALDAIGAVRRETSSADVRAFAAHLARQHANHVSQINDWLARRNVPAQTVEQLPATWAELRRVLLSDDANVALAACEMLEAAMIAAYQSVSSDSRLESSARHLAHRHALELRCSRKFYPVRLERLRRRQAPRPRPFDAEQQVVATAASA